MATVTESQVERAKAERKFYCRMALFLVALVFLGFAPSFYLRGIVPSYPRPNPTLPPSVMLHGGLFTLWMLLFIAQTQLVSAGRRDFHMVLGKATMLLAIVLVPVMYLIAVWAVARESHPPFIDGLNWTIVPLAVIPSFAILVWQGWRNRRQAQTHKRLMLSAAIVAMMGPAIARLPIAPPTLGGFTFQLLLGLALFLPLFLWDRRSIGHVHRATWLGFLLAVITIVIPLSVFWSGADWASIAARLPGV
jgi:hypothetical protein